MISFKRAKGNILTLLPMGCFILLTKVNGGKKMTDQNLEVQCAFLT